jgi:Prealbumin-like fold domain
MRKVAITGAVAMLASLLMVISMVGTAAAALPGSNFEIDADANLRVDGADPPSLDWANVDDTSQADSPSGAQDESFGQGTKEDTAVPSVVDGGIPPNKSDLKFFGSYLEENAAGKFLNIYWARVQDPSGTTNMDFEFNKSDVTSANGVTPVRTSGDVLIQYDLSQGGVNPVLFISRWLAVGDTGACQAGNQKPCWSTKQNLSAAGDAVGSINTSLIPASESDGLGQLDPRTFGEAQIDFAAFGGGEGECVGFGSAYLKSRSSDSFTSALKDFIPPVALNFNECGALKISKTAKHAAAESGSINQAGVTFTVTPPVGDAFDVVTGADGTVCVSGLEGGSYSVTETVPTGYAAEGDLTKTATVTEGTTCADVAAVPFVNIPLTDLTVTINSQVDGGTASTVDCVVTNTTTEVLAFDTDIDGTNGDGTETATNLQPQEITCTIVIDP